MCVFYVHDMLRKTVDTDKQSLSAATIDTGEFFASSHFEITILLLIFAFLPLWDYIHSIQSFRIFLQGVNATAIGLVIAACIVLWNNAINNLSQASIAVITASMVGLFNIPAPISIIVGTFIGWLMTDQVFGIAQTDLCPT